MRGHLLHRIEAYFFLLYAEHFSRIPQGDIWDSAYGYGKEVAKILASLARRSNANIALVGQKGVGSLGIAKEAARQLEHHPELRGHSTFFVNIEELLQSATPGIEQLHAIAKVVSQMEKGGKSVVVITGMADVFAGKYKLSAEDVLHPFYASPHIRTITILSDEEYHSHIASHEGLSHAVQKVQVDGLSVHDTKQFLRDAFGQSVSHDLLDEVVDRAEHLYPHIPFPKRAVDIVQELLADKKSSHHHVAAHISQRNGLDIQRMREIREEDIAHALSHRVFHQERAIDEIQRALLCAKSRQGSMKRPIASLLFEGPAGVGKTEAAKALAEAYFGSSGRIVHIDIKNLVQDVVSAAVEHPFSILFIRGLDGASPGEQDMLASMLHEGYVVDTFGRKYFTTHMIILGVCRDRSLCSEHLVQNFDGVVSFAELNMEARREIARRKLAKLNGSFQLEHDVSLEISPELVECVVQAGFESVEATIKPLALQKISQGKVMPGGKIVIDPRQFA